ncbi:MAG: hypothetical protein JST82_07705 [Bacteroidetes bacterium]|nr:hypothetical protein [Bacteroidota bacterium]
MRNISAVIILSALLLQSCGNDNPNSGKPIVLGDSSTIVTEADSQYLQDFVADIKPIQPVTLPEAPHEDTAAKQAQAEKEAIPQQEEEKKPEVKQPAEAKVTAAPKGNGLNIEFTGLTVLIPNLNTRSYRSQDAKKANGVSYELVSGTLAGNHIKTGVGNVTKVSQRYQTVIAIKNEMGTLFLESLNRTTDWQPLRGKNNDYVITGLDAAHLQYLNATPAAIKNALDRAARNKRISKANLQKWQNSIKKVRSANQKPLVVVLRSVMWKIEGKDAQGKPFNKQIRIDIPLK